MKNKKALSQIISVLLLIVLTLVMIGIIWTAIDRYLLTKLEDTKSCYGVYDQLIINNENTCYNASSNQVKLYLELKEIEPESILISINLGTTANIYKIYNESGVVEGVTLLGGSTSISLPSQNGGKLYLISGISSRPEGIQIAPKMKGKQCDVTDSLEEVPFC